MKILRLAILFTELRIDDVVSFGQPCQIGDGGRSNLSPLMHHNRKVTSACLWF